MWNPADLYTPCVYLLFVTYHIPTTSTAILTPKIYHSKNSSIKWLLYYYLWPIYPIVKVLIEANDVRRYSHFIIREIRTGFSSKWVFSVSDYRRPTWHSEKIFTIKFPPDRLLWIRVQPIEKPPLPCYRLSRTHGHSAAQRITSMKIACIN